MVGGNIVRICVEIARLSHERRTVTSDSLGGFTAEGTIDLAKLPIDGILRQAIDPELERFRSACVLLGSMASAGRLEAGLYLIGLPACYASDLQKLEVIAGQLGLFPHESSANALLA